MEKSVFQKHAELSPFDDTAFRERASTGDVARAKAIPVVIGAQPVTYAPEDPRADWSGLVGRAPSRAHVRGRKGVLEDGGDVKTTGRKHFQRHQATCPWTPMATPNFRTEAMDLGN